MQPMLLCEKETEGEIGNERAKREIKKGEGDRGGRLNRVSRVTMWLRVSPPSNEEKKRVNMCTSCRKTPER